MGKRRKSRRRAASRYDLDTIKRAAAGQWVDILTRLGGIDPNILDGQHHPCPKCGGTDRFRAIDIDEGALLCNQCFTGQGDGIASLRWINNWTFQDTLKALSDHLRLDGGEQKKESAATTSPDTKTKKKKIIWLPEALKTLFFAAFCESKRPIQPQSLETAKARVGQWPPNASAENRQDVIALPVIRSLETDPVGAVLYKRDGSSFPSIPRSLKGPGLPERKIHVLSGTPCGIIIAQPREEFSRAHTIWKVEGPSDLLSIVALLPPGVVAFTTSHGAKVFSAELAAIVSGKCLIVCHDADQPGEDGAGIVAARCATLAAEIKRCRLPYPIEQNHGHDLRDWLNDASANQPRTYEDLLSLVDATDQAPPPAASQAIGPASPADVEEAPDDPHRLARICAGRWDRVAFYQDEWYVGTVSAGWKSIKEPELRAYLVASIKAEFDSLNRQDREAAAAAGEPLPLCRKVCGHLVTNVLTALRSLYLISGTITPNTCLATINQGEGLPEIQPGPKDWIAVENGILCLDRLFSEDPAEAENCLLPHTLDWWSTVRLPYKFDPTAECPLWDKFLNRSLEGDKERISLLQEWAGYLLLPNNQNQKFLVLEGEGGNGKSVFFAGMQALLGPDQVSNVSLDDFGQRFHLTATLGKLANISADTGEIDKPCEGHLKSYCTGEPMFFDRKGISGINVRPTARLMVGVNNRPRFSDRSDGIWRRMLLVPWRVRISSAEKIMGMDSHEWWMKRGQLPGILNWAIRGLHRLRNQPDFTVPSICMEAIDSYRTEINPAREFLIDHFQVDESGMKKSEEVYRTYRDWCTANGYRPLAANTFGKEVKRVFPGVVYKQARVDGMRIWHYQNLATRIDDDDDF